MAFRKKRNSYHRVWTANLMRSRIRILRNKDRKKMLSVVSENLRWVPETFHALFPVSVKSYK